MVDSFFKDQLLIKVSDLTIKTLHSSDVTEEYRSWFIDPEVTTFIEYAQKTVRLVDLKKFVDEKLNSKDALLLGIFDDQEHVGNIKFEPIDLDHKTAVLGILIGNQKYRSRGVGPLVIQACCCYLNKKLDIQTFELGVVSNNERAVRSYEKCGFKVVNESHFLSSDKGLIMRLKL